jgi:hypothetical protein
VFLKFIVSVELLLVPLGEIPTTDPTTNTNVFDDLSV